MISMYWWEGYYGIQYSLGRLLTGKRPYVRNVGDQLSPFIVALLSGQQIKHSQASAKLLALGSIFFSLRDDDIVWGSGLIEPNHINFVLKRKSITFTAVRGPKTREILLQHGIPCPEIYGDPALLLPHLIKNDIQYKYHIGIVPHYAHYDAFKKLYAKNKKCKIIDVEQPFYDVIRTLLSCEIILSTSLHGVIVSEAYGIPALLLTMGTPLYGGMFKFEDYFYATGRSLFFADYTHTNTLTKLAKQAQNSTLPKLHGLKKLWHAFPFNRAVTFGSSPTISWSTCNFLHYQFKSSMKPPQWYIPTSRF